MTLEQAQDEIKRLKAWQTQMINKMADKRLPAYREQSLELLAAIQRAEAAETKLKQAGDTIEALLKELEYAETTRDQWIALCAK